MKTKTNEYGFYFWLHLIILFAIYTMPFTIDWRIIGILIALYYLQIQIFGGCVLTIRQFGTEESRHLNFHHHYLTKLGFKLKEERVRWTVDKVIPWVLFGLGIVWQVLLHQKPLGIGI